MTEQEWLTSGNPAAMLDFISGGAGAAYQGPGGIRPTKISGIKLRLFADACRHSFYHGYLIRTGSWSGWESDGHMQSRHRDEGLTAEIATRCWAAEMAVAEQPRRAAFLRDIVGNPFRPVRLPLDRVVGRTRSTDFFPDGIPLGECSWLTPTVISLTWAAYDKRLHDDTLDPFCLGLLADALEEAGCDSEELLLHLRGWVPMRGGGYSRLCSPVHVRGCWAVDLLLGKE